MNHWSVQDVRKDSLCDLVNELRNRDCVTGERGRTLGERGLEELLNHV